MPEQDVKAVKRAGSLLAVTGAISLLVGVILLFEPGSSLAALAVIVGIFLLVDGILELIAAFMRLTPNRGMVAVFGVITAVVGVLLIRHPVGGITAVALLIGIWLIAVGVIRFVTAIDEPQHRVWYAFLGALELIAGIVIVADPNIGYTTLAILVGIGFVLNGFGMMALGRGLREAVRAAPGRA